MGETLFEKPRGISRVEVRTGYAQVQISGLAQPVTEARIALLGAVSEAGVSLDFLKMTPNGLSFLVKEDLPDALSKTLERIGVKFAIQSDRHVVMVHAVNMRDEEGLIANIVLKAIGTGASIDHVADMHDRVLLVMGAEDAQRVQQTLEQSLMAGARA